MNVHACLSVWIISFYSRDHSHKSERKILSKCCSQSHIHMMVVTTLSSDNMLLLLNLTDGCFTGDDGELMRVTYICVYILVILFVFLSSPWSPTLPVCIQGYYSFQCIPTDRSSLRIHLLFHPSLSLRTCTGRSLSDARKWSDRNRNNRWRSVLVVPVSHLP